MLYYEKNGPNLKKGVITCRVICTKWALIYTVNLQSLLFCAKKYGPGWSCGWIDGWMGGRAGLRIAYSNQKLPTMLMFRWSFSVLFSLMTSSIWLAVMLLSLRSAYSYYININ